MKKNYKDTAFVFDGAMGTYYNSIAERPLPACEMANLFDEKTVYEIHSRYVEAGCNAIKTNTFGANTVALSAEFDVVDKIIRNGVALAKSAAAGRDIKIYADIGPISYECRDSLDEYLRIIDIFIDEGLENFLFETFSEPECIPKLAVYIKEKLPSAHIITSFAVNPDGFTRSGYSGETLLAEMANLRDIDVVGYNCISGPYHLAEYIKRSSLPNKPLSIMPNAGYPTVVGNRTYYSDNSSYFANVTSEFIDFGFSYLGGCCGTTPEHIEKLVAEVSKSKVEPVTHATAKTGLRLVTDPVENLVYKKLLDGQKIIAVEYDPPASIDISTYMDNVKRLKTAGVDAITIADCPVGRARFDSSLMAYKIKNEIGIDPIVHLTCRDRNLNATKALLLGLNVENILNLIIVTGDPIPTAEKDEIKSVFNFNSGLLTKYIKKLNEDMFTNPMVVSMALNLNAPNFGAELRKALRKEENGADMFFTQPILSARAVENLKTARGALKARIMGGIIPVISHKNAVFMHEEISGITMDQEIIEAYRDLNKDDATEKAIQLSLGFIDRIKDLVDGYYLITPFNRVDIIERIIRELNYPK